MASAWVVACGGAERAAVVSEITWRNSDARHAAYGEARPSVRACAECGHAIELAGQVWDHVRVADVGRRRCICVRRDEACWPSAEPGSQVRALAG